DAVLVAKLSTPAAHRQAVRRQPMTRVVVATGIYTVVVATTIAVSGAPATVHAVDALGFLIAFWIPAQFVGSVPDLKRRMMPSAILILLGCLTWDVLSAIVISKREFLRAAPFVYGGGL